MKKAIAIIIVILLVAGWSFSIFGLNIGDTALAPIKDRVKLGLDLKGGVYVVLEAQTDLKGTELKKLMQQTQEVIARRVNAMGLSEPNVTIEGSKRIRVELPGASNAEEAIQQIGKTAQLQFVKPDGTVILTGSEVKDSGIELNQQDADGSYAVTLKFNSKGAQAFKNATKELAALPESYITLNNGQQISNKAIMIVLDGEIISAPRVSAEIPNGQAIITGGFTDTEAANLSALIRGGALPVNLKEVETSVVGPTLGIDALKTSIVAGFIGIALIAAFMIFFYRMLGLIASLALALYVLLLVWIIVAFNAVLTLPGIAGLILSIGMAIDADVIIFSRIRDEVRNEKTIRVAVKSGFNRAMATVLDSNITTIIAALVLYQYGSGPVKGFAAILMIGVVLSMLTAVLITQMLLASIVDTPLLNKKQYLGLKENNERESKLMKLSVIDNRKIMYLISVAVIVASLGFGAVRGFNYGIDFTGGTMIQINMEKEVPVNEIREIIKKHGIEADIVYAGQNNEQIQIKTVQALDSNARTALFDDFFAKYKLTQKNIIQIEQFGPSVGDELKKNAFMGVLLASLFMMVYIAFRFEFKFATGAIVALFHDILVMIAFYALFRIPINSPFIAAVLTILGYSINDTIVVFDRIRENLKTMSKVKTNEMVDISVNQVLGRSVNTSFMTILAIVALYIMGVETIKNFTLPLLVGIISGTYSSIFVASTLWYDLNRLMGDKPRYQGKKKNRKPVRLFK